MKVDPGVGFSTLQAGRFLGWASLTAVALIVLLSVFQPSPPLFLEPPLNPALLLVVGFIAGIIGAFLCWLGMGSGNPKMARNGIIRGIAGAVLNALVLSLTTITSVVITPA